MPHRIALRCLGTNRYVSRSMMSLCALASRKNHFITNDGKRKGFSQYKQDSAN